MDDIIFSDVSFPYTCHVIVSLNVYLQIFIYLLVIFYSYVNVHVLYFCQLYEDVLSKVTIFLREYT